ncbi:hypothetical protein Tco_1374681, partial [Tanacetum coccineum]
HMDLGPVELAMKKPRALSLPSSQQGGEAALPVTIVLPDSVEIGLSCFVQTQHQDEYISQHT